MVLQAVNAKPTGGGVPYKVAMAIFSGAWRRDGRVTLTLGRPAKPGAAEAHRRVGAPPCAKKRAKKPGLFAKQPQASGPWKSLYAKNLSCLII